MYCYANFAIAFGPNVRGKSLRGTNCFKEDIPCPLEESQYRRQDETCSPALSFFLRGVLFTVTMAIYYGISGEQNLQIKVKYF